MAANQNLLGLEIIKSILLIGVQNVVVSTQGEAKQDVHLLRQEEFGTGGLTMTDRERLKEKIDYLQKVFMEDDDYDYFNEFLADRLLADKDIIVPPCKVGDTVYYIALGKVYKGKCHAITMKHTLQVHLYDFDGDNASYPAKKVFLTKEEAEAELEKRCNNAKND